MGAVAVDAAVSLTVKVPVVTAAPGFPGDRFPPVLTDRLFPLARLRVPVPPSVALPPTETLPALLEVPEIEPATTRLPPLTVVVPVWVFAPVKANVPDPDFTRLPVPVIAPANVVDVLSPPVSSVKSEARFTVAVVSLLFSDPILCVSAVAAWKS